MKKQCPLQFTACFTSTSTLNCSEARTLDYISCVKYNYEWIYYCIYELILHSGVHIMTKIQATPQKELENCTYVKTILMILVVLYHSTLFWNGTWFTANPLCEAKVLGLFARWLNTFHIYGFTLVSGYLFYYLKFEKGKYQQFGAFLKSKAKRLLIPYAFIAAIWVAPGHYLWNDFTISSLVLKYILGTAPSQLWFLLMLFVVFVIAWPLSQFLEKHTFLSVGIAVLLYGLGLVGNNLIPNVFQILTAFEYFIFFLAGFKIRQYGSKHLMKIPGFIWIAGSILLFSGYEMISSNGSFFVKLLSFGLSAACNMVGAVMAFVVLQKIANRTDYQNSRLFNCLSNCSMTIYMLHQQIVYLFIVILNGVVNPYLNASVNFLGSLTISIAVALVLKKFKLTRFLIGEK